jgi:ribosome biogenesis GTPase
VNKGIVIKSTGSWYTVFDSGVEILCRIKGKLRLKDIKTTNPVTVGDKVYYDLADANTGIITKIEERKNYIIRRATHFHKEAHLLAANIDLVFIMVCLKSPLTPFEFIDRLLVTAEAYHIESVILINKIDLLNHEGNITLERFIKTYSFAGYKCISMSVEKNLNVGQTKELMQGKISLIAGNSGVGKTSLINKFDPSLNLKTAEISEYHKSGKHTTALSELFCIDNETYVIDTPGIKGFGLVDFNRAEIGLFFPEIFRISKECKFYNCSHIHEPQCAVINAIEQGQIGESRYKSYFNMVTDEQSKYRY